jgi:hypothetical protein
MQNQSNYSLLSDEKLVEALVTTPADNELHKYFFKEKCKRFLKYISSTIYHEDNSDTLIGEFYEYLSAGDWKVLKEWKGKNGCSLYSYLSSCTIRYFISKRNKEKRRSKHEFIPETPEIIESLNHITEEENTDYQYVRDAFTMLSNRNKTILRLLLLDGKEMLEAAPEIWPYIKSQHKLEELSAKQIQSTISMVKQRATMAFVKNLIEAGEIQKMTRLQREGKKPSRKNDC